MVEGLSLIPAATLIKILHYRTEDESFYSTFSISNQKHEARLSGVFCK